MRRSIPAALVLVVGVVLVLDLLVANPTLDTVTGGLLEIVVVLVAVAALLGAGTLAVHHARRLAGPDDDRVGSALVLAGLAVVLVPGLAAPGGAGSPLVRWLVGALVVPIAASLIALTAIFILPAARRGMRLRARETGVVLLAAMVTLVLLLPLDGAAGAAGADAASWLLGVPVAGVFVGLLVGTAIAAAVLGARVLFGLTRTDD